MTCVSGKGIGCKYFSIFCWYFCIYVFESLCICAFLYLCICIFVYLYFNTEQIVGLRDRCRVGYWLLISEANLISGNVSPDKCFPVTVSLIAQHIFGGQQKGENAALCKNINIWPAG